MNFPNVSFGFQTYCWKIKLDSYYSFKYFQVLLGWFNDLKLNVVKFYFESFLCWPI
jgi:hypothetical protein